MVPTIEETGRGPSALQDPQRRGRLVIGGMSLLIAGGYTWEAFSIPQQISGQPGPGMWPAAIGVAWLVISAIVLAEAALSAQVGGATDFPSGRQRTNVIAFFLLTVGMVVLMPWIGAYLASILYVVAMLKVLSPLPWWKVGVLGAAIGCAIPLVFIIVLQVPLPVGVLGEYLGLG